AEARHLGEVLARRERASSTRDDDARDVVARCRVAQRLAGRVIQRVVERIQRFGPVERQPPDALRVVDPQHAAQSRGTDDDLAHRSGTPSGRNEGAERVARCYGRNGGAVSRRLVAASTGTLLGMTSPNAGASPRPTTRPSAVTNQ